MRYIYTAIFEPNEDGTKYYSKVPDLPGCITTGNSLDDAIEMITDAASGWLVVAEDEGNEIPAATPQYNLNIPKNAICSIIRIDTLSYRAATDTRAVRKNVSLPAWMAALAEKKGVNCSQVLQDGLMHLLDSGLTYPEPVFITKNGKGDLAVMNIEAYEELISRLELYSQIKEGMNDIASGNTRPFSDAMADIRRRRKR